MTTAIERVAEAQAKKLDKLENANLRAKAEAALSMQRLVHGSEVFGGAVLAGVVDAFAPADAAHTTLNITDKVRVPIVPAVAVTAGLVGVSGFAGDYSEDLLFFGLGTGAAAVSGFTRNAVQKLRNK